MRTTSLAYFAALPLVLVGCGVFSSGTADADGPAPLAEPTAAEPVAPPLEGTPAADELTEKFGLFVAPTGTAEGEGTRERPLGSVSQAIAKGKEVHKRVYVCAGAFREVVTLERGVPVVGGLDCSTWKPTGGKTKIEAPSSPAMVAKGIDIRTRVEGFEVIAPDGTSGTASSIALHAETSPGLFIARSKLVAGKGHDGASGSNGVQLTLGAAANGGAGVDASSSPSWVLLQPFPHRAGEAGGVGECIGEANHDGEPGGVGGKGGTYTCQAQNLGGGGIVYRWATYHASTNGVPKSGARGAAGADGESATAIGALSVNGYTPANGSAGTNGAPGKGGSGGAGGSMSTTFCSQETVGFGATGAGGGAGGCPGLAGTAGEGGGASIGALVIASGGLTFDATEIEAHDGGNGGKGSFGSSATDGGAPGVKKGTGTGAGAGGAGGRSGVSGSGAGGPSFGVAHTEGVPVFTNGARAKAGRAGSGVAAETITDAHRDVKTLAGSADGIANDDYAF